ncbi:hypothetical protein EON80_17265 [bacterium]|nr:MAG: hypothetical protein EON80_17265 [bacterium]
MPKKLGREIALLCMPIAVIAGFAVWRNRDAPPEDLWSGKARLLTRVRELPVSPFDQYRGYTQRIAIDQWAAGQLPPVPAPRVGATRSYRQVEPNYSSLYVEFRQGHVWKRTRSVSEAVGMDSKIPSKIPSVKPEFASLWMEAVDSVGQDRGKFTSNYVLRLPKSPPVDEAFLCGQTKADIQDRDVKMAGGGTIDDIVKQSAISSQPMKVKLESLGTDESFRVESAASSRQSEWKVSMVTVQPPGKWSNELEIDLDLSATSSKSSFGRIRMVNPRLLDARGRPIDGYSSYGSGGRPVSSSDIPANVHFQISPQKWKKLLRPLTLQTALSVNNGWPEEVNVELGAAHVELPSKPSKLRFVREPLPMR